MGVLFRIRGTSRKATGSFGTNIVEPMSYSSLAELKSIVPPCWKNEHGIQPPRTVKNIARKLKSYSYQNEDVKRIYILYEKAAQLGAYVER
jgi:hypothetical protein